MDQHKVIQLEKIEIPKGKLGEYCTGLKPVSVTPGKYVLIARCYYYKYTL